MFTNLSLSIIISIAALACVDSINPVELLAGIFLFTAKKPISRFLPYAIGIFFFHLLLGFVFYYTFHYILDLKIFDSPIFDRSIELIGGILLVAFGFIMKKYNKSKAESILNPKPLYTFLMGIGITASAIPTSAAYFSALGIVANNKLNFDGLSFLMLIYNIIFVLPLFILLIIYILSRKNSQKIFESVRNFITQRLNAILKVVFVLAGLVLITDFIFYLFHRSFL